MGNMNVVNTIGENQWGVKNGKQSRYPTDVIVDLYTRSHHKVDVLRNGEIHSFLFTFDLIK